MNVFGIGPWEMVLILIVALVVFGPSKLPEIGNTVGRTIREFRRASSEFTAEINRELRLEESAREARQQSTVTASQPAPAADLGISPAAAQGAVPSHTVPAASNGKPPGEDLKSA